MCIHVHTRTHIHTNRETNSTWPNFPRSNPTNQFSNQPTHTCFASLSNVGLLVVCNKLHKGLVLFHFLGKCIIESRIKCGREFSSFQLSQQDLRRGTGMWLCLLKCTTTSDSELTHSYEEIHRINSTLNIPHTLIPH